MMMGIGFLIMLAILAVPILLVLGIVMLLVKPVFGHAGAAAAGPAAPLVSRPKPDTCSHCGAKLQPEWNHCPQCGAPI